MGRAMRSHFGLFALGLVTLMSGCARQDAPVEPLGQADEAYDIVIRGGTIYDGSGGEPYVGDLAIRADRIAAVGDVGELPAGRTIEAAGMAVSPGFINMMSHSQETLQIDGRAQSDIRQGVTLEIMGEGFS